MPVVPVVPLPPVPPPGDPDAQVVSYVGPPPPVDAPVPVGMVVRVMPPIVPQDYAKGEGVPPVPAEVEVGFGVDYDEGVSGRLFTSRPERVSVYPERGTL